MTSSDYANELQRRFGDVVRWAMENWPDQSRPLSEVEFAIARKEMEKIADLAQRGAAADSGAEPSEGGAQYVNMNPTPWP
jgi:hypothetical protein